MTPSLDLVSHVCIGSEGRAASINDSRAYDRSKPWDKYPVEMLLDVA